MDVTQTTPGSAPDDPRGGTHGRREGSAPFEPGTLIAGRYRIVARLGAGGMGEVYRADDLTLGQSVALKFLAERFANTPALRTRFLDEVRIARQVSHAHVCRVYDVGEHDSRTYLSMEFVDGEDLASLLRRIGRLSGDKAVELARQMCLGLAAAHSTGVLHRDIKPANIMIDGRGKVRITDFGLAAFADRLHAGEARAGTPAYMAPEQIDGRAVSVRSDIFALGLVFHEMFTGKRIFDAPTLSGLRAQHSRPSSTSTTSAADVDPAVQRLIARMLDEDPARRPDSAIAVAAALPGGDPLAAALAAGETPSPEMVAAARAGERVSPAWVIGSAVVGLLGFVAFVMLSENATLHTAAALPLRPEVLEQRARDVIKELGFPYDANDSAHNFYIRNPYLNWLKDHQTGAQRWAPLREPHHQAIAYWFRQHTTDLEAVTVSGRVGLNDPPRIRLGMAFVLLDPSGRLTQFSAPPARIVADGPKQPYDWSRMLTAAGLDQAPLEPAESIVAPPDFCDERRAWLTAFPGLAERSVRIEAAAAGGVPVYFQLFGPWDQLTPTTPPEPALRHGVLEYVLVGMIMTGIIGGTLLSRRSASQCRGDYRGAIRMASGIGTLRMLGWVLSADHVSAPMAEFNLFLRAGADASFMSLAVWGMYMGLEPYVRRRWPGTIVCWTRMLGGRIRDPLVGAEVAFGIAAGVIIALLRLGPHLLAAAQGDPRIPQLGLAWEAMDSTFGLRASVVVIAEAAAIALLIGSWVLFMMFLFRVVLRRSWAAGIGFTVVFTAIHAGGALESGDWPRLAAEAAVWTVMTFLMLRVGFLSAMAAFITLRLLMAAPLTSNFSAWFIESSLLSSALVLGTLAYFTRRALAGVEWSRSAAYPA